VLRIFITLKNPSSWPGSNPKPLGPVAITLTSIPPRRLIAGVLPLILIKHETDCKRKFISGHPFDPDIFCTRVVSAELPREL
jgi:hypothetical protein